MYINYIRNFSIIAHIDHGKSTLSDRLIQFCDGLPTREMKEQVLDKMDLERERGITIKSQSVALNYRSPSGINYNLNFVDTPGHADFFSEVSKPLYVSNGSLLVVDATQGVKAQTVAVCYEAIERNLEIIPVLNKMDVAHADPERVKREIIEIIGIDASNSVLISAKTGFGIEDLLEQIVNRIPAPIGDSNSKLQALIIDSWFDPYLGVVSLVGVKNGTISVGDSITVMSSNKNYKVEYAGVFTPKLKYLNCLRAGEIGFISANVKDIHGAPVGYTITSSANPSNIPLKSAKKNTPQVFASLFTTSAEKFPDFREALAKLQLNDASLVYQTQTSDALGFGFRCGFLGLLHMEIVKERLEREYDLDLIITPPSVPYEVLTKNDQTKIVENPSELPNIADIVEIREPIAEVDILAPKEYVGDIITLCIDRRGVQKSITYYEKQVSIKYEMPMSEILIDFLDKIKSISHGYASFDYYFKAYVASDLVKLDILINTERVDALSFILHRNQSVSKGRRIVEKLKNLIPRQMFDVAIQAALGSKIIARETVKAMRKNVIAKCYGGDVTRKMKLLKKQKEGKKRMKNIGKVDIPNEAFLAILKTDN